MAELVEKKFDMVLTSLKVNGERESAVDFTAPFLESGTSILVAKRTGIISPYAFLGKEKICTSSSLLFLFFEILKWKLFYFYFSEKRSFTPYPERGKKVDIAECQQASCREDEE